jgi:hypothetical protein
MIKTKASLIKEKEAAKCFKVVKAEAPKRLPKTAPPNGFKKEENSEDEAFNEIFGDGPKRRPKKDKNQVTFDSARREILNFGLSGKNADEKSDQTEQLLIKLGAKPLKKKSRNYKEILEEKRKEKLEGEKINRRALFGTSATLQYQNQSKKRDDGLLKKYGRVAKKDRESIKKSFNKRK